MPYLSQKKLLGNLTLFSFFSIVLAFQSQAQMRQMYLDSDPDVEISKISFFSPSEGYIATYKWIAYTADSGKTFTKKYVTVYNVNTSIYTVNVTLGYYIWGVKAFDKNNIILWGHYGYVPAILYSSDGGNTFKLVFHSQFDPLKLPGGVLDMVFPGNGQTGYATDPDRILKTTDGGQTWSVNRTLPGSFFSRLEAPDLNVIYAYSSTKYSAIRTADAGKNWTYLSLPQLGTSIESAYFDLLRGWINVEENGRHYLYMTTNSGNTWIQQNDPDIIPFSSTRMKFTDYNTGYALGSQYKVWKTYDGGKLWEPLARNNQYNSEYNTHIDMNFLTSQQFWAGGQHGFLEMTTNAGDTTIPQGYFKIDTAGLGATGSIQLVNYSKKGYQYSWYVNNIPAGTGYNSSYTHNFSLFTDTVKLVVSNGLYKDSTTKYHLFNIPLLPQPSGFSPKAGSQGTVITIKGKRFSGVIGVSFGGSPATSFIVASDTIIYAVIDKGSTGDIKVSNADGGSLLPGFIYIMPPGFAAPVITDFTPASGPIGTTLVIHGSNFDALPANNIVGLGGVNALITAASTTQLTCKIPAGVTTTQLSVTNLSTHLSAAAEQPFGLVFADSGNFTTHSFVPKFEFKKSEPYMIRAADIDGDGKTDLACNIVVRSEDSIYVLKNQSVNDSFAFSDPITIIGSKLSYWHDFTVQDLDVDGRPDIVLHTNERWIRVHRNLSSPGVVRFDTAIVLNVGSNVSFTTTNYSDAMDLDGDGRPDLAISSFSDSAIILVRNTSSPGLLSFARDIRLKLAGNSGGVALGDLDGDGKKDIAAMGGSVNDKNNALTVFLNNSSVGNLVFTDKQSFALQSRIFEGHKIKIIDFDGDGKSDVVIVIDDAIFVFRNISTPGNISLQKPLIYPKKWQISRDGWIADLNGDAKPDIVSTLNGSDQFILYRNTSRPGMVSIDSPVVISTKSPVSSGVAAAEGDFNGDGKTDIAFANGYYQGSVVVHKNNMGEKVDLKNCAGGRQEISADIPGKSFQWQLSTGSGFTNIVNGPGIRGADSSVLVLTNIPVAMDGYMFRCLSPGFTGSTFILHVLPVDLPEVSISTPITTICAGTEVTFSSAVVNPGKSSNYSWRVDGAYAGTGGDEFTSSRLKDGSKVQLIFAAYDACNFPHVDTSNTIAMTVNGGIPSVSISTPTISICKGAPITFSATPVWGGTPSFQWQVNGVNVGTNTPQFTSTTLNNGDYVKVIMTANGYCISSIPVTSDGIVVRVNDYITPAVTIKAAQTRICEGNLASFLPTPVNGGSTPSYQWLVNGSPVAKGPYYSSTALKPGDDVQCQMTSSFACLLTPIASSNTIKMEAGVCFSPDNFMIETFSATCRDKNDGSIHIAVKQDLGYTVNISGPGGYNVSTSFTGLNYDMNSLPPGIYTACFNTDNLTGDPRCFTLTINQPPLLRVATTVEQKTITLSLNGGSSYAITFNGATTITADSVVQLSLQEGLNDISVSTGQVCQGTFSAVFIAGNTTAGLHLYPNPANDETTLYVPGNEGKLQLKIINASTGAITSNSILSISTSRLVRVPLAGFAPGVYILQVKSDTINESLKLVKQ